MSDDFPVPGLRIATGDICDTDPFTDRITVGAIFAIILNDGVNRTRNFSNGLGYCHSKHLPQYIVHYTTLQYYIQGGFRNFFAMKTALIQVREEPFQSK
jgi:hypothetical protein